MMEHRFHGIIKPSHISTHKTKQNGTNEKTERKNYTNNIKYNELQLCAFMILWVNEVELNWTMETALSFLDIRLLVYLFIFGSQLVNITKIVK